MKTLEEIMRQVREADARLRERARREKQERKQLRRRNTGRPCKATTKQGQPYRAKAYGNGYCGVHGGMDAMRYQQELMRKPRARRAKQWTPAK